MAFHSRRSNTISSIHPLNLFRLLPNPEQHARFLTLFLNRPVLTPKFGNLDSFTNEGFLFLALITSQSLDNFVSLQKTYYPELVKVFFCNMVVHEDVLTSNVKGVSIHLSLKNLGDCLGIPYHGAKLGTNIQCPWDDYDKETFYHSLCRFEDTAIQNLHPLPVSSRSRGWRDVCIFTTNNHLLHFFLSQIILPQHESYAYISELELQILFEIIHLKPINWAYLVMQHILKCRSQAPFLPYAYVISCILILSGVPIACRYDISLNNSHRFDTIILSRLGLFQDFGLDLLPWILNSRRPSSLPSASKSSVDSADL